METRVREDLKHLLKELDLLKYPAAELGCAEGLFSRDILNWGVAMLYSVDFWGHIPNVKGDGNSDNEWHNANYENAKKLLAPFGDRSVMIKDYTVPAAAKFHDESLGFIYFDANHSYEGVLADLKAWYPKLKQGGIIAGHDFINPDYGVHAAVTHFTTKVIVAKVELIPDIDMEHAGFWFQKK